MTVTRPIPTAKTTNKFRVLVVDDSAVIRGMITRWLETDPSIDVAGSAANGKLALTAAQRCNPEVIILDIEMPEMDGLTALPLLKKAHPKSHILMASTLTLRNADISLKAMRLGASDYIPKPESRNELSTGAEFKTAIVEKVIALATAKRKQAGEPLPPSIARPGNASAQRMASLAVPAAPRNQPPAASAKPRPNAGPPQVLAIGSSTGGPQALFSFFQGVGSSLKVPVLITQHMPPTFTSILATHISKAAGVTCKEGEHGEVVKPGHVYVAPGDFHMTVKGKPNAPIIQLDNGPQENFCRPSVDPMFRSVFDVYGGRAVALVFTGMGSDGLKGARLLRHAGAPIIVQDEQTSVVWGMPGAIAKEQLADAILPLPRIAPEIKRIMTGGRI